MRRLLIPLCACLLLLLGAATPGAVANPQEGDCNVTTGAVADVTSTSATLNGTIGGYPGDATFCGAWQFDYGPTFAYGTTTAPGDLHEGTDVPVSASIGGLTPNTTYHFRLRASSGNSNVGLDVTFMTLSPPLCGAVTGTATAVTATTATFNGVLGVGSGADAINCGGWQFDYGTTAAYGSATPTGMSGQAQDFPVTASLSGLTPNTTYHFRVHAESGGGNLGDDVTFTTLPGACSAVTGVATNLTTTSATLTATLGSTAGSDAAYCGQWRFDYGTTAAYGSATADTAPGSGANVAVSVPVSGLAPDTTYHFRVRADTGTGSVGTDVTFTTLPAPPASCGALTGLATNVTPTSATVTATLGATAGSDAANCGLWRFDYGTTAAYGSTTASSPPGSGTNIVLGAIFGLAPGTTYHFRVRADSGVGNVGSDMTFTTGMPAPPPPPARAALRVSASVSPTTIVGSGLVTFTTVITNAGPGDANGVVLTQSLPAGLGSVVAVSTRGGCTVGASVSCAIGSLPNGQTATVTINAAASLSAPVTSTAAVTADNIDTGQLANATAGATIGYSAPVLPTPVTPSTPTTPANGSTVVFDRSIGGVSIGMTDEAVQKLLGKPKSTLKVSLGGGSRGTFSRYTSHGAAFLVIFDASGRVVSIETYSTFFKTAAGVGPGSALASVRALEGFRQDFCELGYWNGTARTGPGSVVTVFTPNGDTVESVLIAQLRFYTACASGSSELPPPVGVVLNRSIAGMSIGMTEQQVVNFLGKPSSTLKLSLGGGKAGKFARYRLHGAPVLVTYDGTGHIVSIEAYSPFFKTAAGVGPGSSLTQIGKLRGFRPDYCELGFWNGTARTRPGDVVTVFTPSGGSVASVLITQLRLYTACATGSKELPPT